MPQIADNLRALFRLHLPQFSAVDSDVAFIRVFTQERLAERRFAACHRARDADDLPLFRREGDIAQHVFSIRISKAQMLHLQLVRSALCVCALRGAFLRLLREQRLDAVPGNLRLIHRVEELRHAGRLDRQLGKAGQECCKRRNRPRLPARSQHILLTEIQDEQHARHGDDAVDWRHRRIPDVGFYRRLLVGGQGLFICFLPFLLASEYAIGDGILRSVQRRRAQLSGLLLVRRARLLNRLFHLFRRHIGYRRENQAKQRQPPVVPEQHARIRRECYAGIEDLRREFAHALHAVVHVQNGFGHHAALALFPKARAALVD